MLFYSIHFSESLTINNLHYIVVRLHNMSTRTGVSRDPHSEQTQCSKQYLVVVRVQRETGCLNSKTSHSLAKTPRLSALRYLDFYERIFYPNWKSFIESYFYCSNLRTAIFIVRFNIKTWLILTSTPVFIPSKTKLRSPEVFASTSAKNGGQRNAIFHVNGCVQKRLGHASDEGY